MKLISVRTESSLRRYIKGVIPPLDTQKILFLLIRLMFITGQSMNGFTVIGDQEKTDWKFLKIILV